MNEISAATGKLLAMSMLSGVSLATLRNASQVFGFENKSVQQLAEEISPELKSALLSGGWSNALIKAEEQSEIAEHSGCRILSPLDEEYPKLLAATKDGPLLLWARGTFAPRPENSVAIVGTCAPTTHGKIIARRITRYFVEKGWSVVSGLAFGCDDIAHQEAINAGGHTLAVLDHDLQTIAAQKHRKLAGDILDAGGALISQYPIGTEVTSQQFVHGAKTQAGLAQGVVLIQSGLQGRSLHVSRAAVNYGRWLAVPYPTLPDRAKHKPKAAANVLLADGREGAVARLLRQEGKTTTPHIIILRSKNDYEQCLRSLSIDTAHRARPSQGMIF